MQLQKCQKKCFFLLREDERSTNYILQMLEPCWLFCWLLNKVSFYWITTMGWYNGIVLVILSTHSEVLSLNHLALSVFTNYQNQYAVQFLFSLTHHKSCYIKVIFKKDLIFFQNPYCRFRRKPQMFKNKTRTN